VYTQRSSSLPALSEHNDHVPNRSDSWREYSPAEGASPSDSPYHQRDNARADVPNSLDSSESANVVWCNSVVQCSISRDKKEAKANDIDGDADKDTGDKGYEVEGLGSHDAERCFGQEFLVCISVWYTVWASGYILWCISEWLDVGMGIDSCPDAGLIWLENTEN
jgi:hypothetical protein